MVLWTGNSLPTQVLNVLSFMANNFGAAISNALLSPKLIEIKVPEDFKVLHPRYEDAYFEKNQSGTYVVAGASVSITAEQINGFMKKHFGNAWHNIPEAAPPTQVKMTRKGLEALCAQYDPQDSVVICGRKMGWDYNQLPE